jgi:TonB-linked SusC/RagA family outer membrane protein
MIRKLLLTALFFSALCIKLSAQDRQVTGKVTGAEDGLPVPGVNVLVQGTNKGTTTDADGNYSIQLSSGESVLVFTFVGFKPATIAVNNQTAINVALESDVTSLDEVVVVGYGEQRKIDITGAVANVEAEEITKQPVVNPISALQGRVAGVQITNSGQPGAAPTIRIRGTGTIAGQTGPLYVVDGVWYDDISFLNPADIASVSVLKDASSQAIYGVRAANGVVLITTNRGKKGSVSISYNGFVGNQVPTNQVEMASGPEYAQMINELDALNGATPRYDDPNAFGTTDWFRQILRNASISNHQISVSGGGERSTFNFSVGYLNQEGLVEGNDFERYTARLQNDFEVFDFLKVGYTVTGAINKSDDAPGGIFNQLYSASPITPVYYADGTYGDPNDYRAGSSNLFNPQATVDFFDQGSQNYRMTGNVFAELSFLKNFTFRTSIGGDFGQNELLQYTPEYVATLSQRNTISQLRRERSEIRNWILENTLAYNFQLGDEHSLRALIGQSGQRYKFYKVEASVQDVPNSSDGDYYFDLGDPSTFLLNDEGDLSTVASYFARVDYSFRDRYLLTATYRADGASKFGSNDRWGYFPSIGVGWILSEESFMADQGIFDYLKVRGSWGRIGNSGVPNNTAVLRVTQIPEYSFVSGGTIAPGANIASIVPPTTVWERGVGTDFGLEAGFLDNRLTAEIDYYIRDTEDAVFGIPVLGSLGLNSSQIEGNQATFRNSGWEFAVTWNDQRSEDFSYSVSANLGINNNEVLSVTSGRNPIFQSVGTTGGAINTRTIVGEPIGHFWGYRVVGVFQDIEDVNSYTGANGQLIQPTAQPGDFKYADINNDGVIDGKDNVILGNPNPRYLYGINTTWRYKAFDLTFDIQGVGGVEIYNATLGARFGTENFTKDFYDNRWTEDRPSNEYPSANIGGGQNYRSNSFYVENGAYVRLRNIQIGYNVPTAAISRSRISSLRIYANAQNALTLTKYRGMTPEIGGAPTRAGVDTNVYPIFATYNVGVNVTF